MLEAILFVVLGVFVGWAFPQPAWAKSMFDAVKGWFTSEEKPQDNSDKTES